MCVSDAVNLDHAELLKEVPKVALRRLLSVAAIDEAAPSGQNLAGMAGERCRRRRLEQFQVGETVSDTQTVDKTREAIVHELLSNGGLAGGSAYRNCCLDLNCWFLEGVDELCDPFRLQFLKANPRGDMAKLLQCAPAHVSRLRTGKRPLTPEVREVIDRNAQGESDFPNQHQQLAARIIACLHGLHREYGIPDSYTFDITPEWLFALCFAMLDEDWLGAWLSENNEVRKSLPARSEVFIEQSQRVLGLPLQKRNGQGLVIIGDDWLQGLMVCEQCLRFLERSFPDCE